MPAAAVCSCPKAPNSTLVNDRFIARHMMMARMNPDDPSSAPATISSLLFSTNPMALADNPAYEFSSAITVGMSAPPMGMISSTPNNNASAAKSGNNTVCSGETINATPTPAAAAKTPRLTKFWPL